MMKQETSRSMVQSAGGISAYPDFFNRRRLPGATRDSGDFHGATMTEFESIQAEIESLSNEDFARPAAWIAERDWQNWDRQIERDSVAGKLDFLRDEVEAAKQQGRLREL
jgi:hypothetical protein